MVWYSCILVPLSFVLMAAFNEILPMIMTLLSHIPIVKNFINQDHENRGRTNEVASTNSNLNNITEHTKKELKVD